MTALRNDDLPKVIFDQAHRPDYDSDHPRCVCGAEAYVDGGYAICPTAEVAFGADDQIVNPNDRSNALVPGWYWPAVGLPAPVGGRHL